MMVYSTMGVWTPVKIEWWCPIEVDMFGDTINLFILWSQVFTVMKKHSYEWDDDSNVYWIGFELRGKPRKTYRNVDLPDKYRVKNLWSFLCNRSLGIRKIPLTVRLAQEIHNLIPPIHMKHPFLWCRKCLFLAVSGGCFLYWDDGVTIIFRSGMIIQVDPNGW